MLQGCFSTKLLIGIDFFIFFYHPPRTLLLSKWLSLIQILKHFVPSKTKRTLYPAQIPQTKHDPHPAYHRICVIRVVPLRLGDAQRIHSITDKKSPSPQCPIDLDWSDELRPMTPEYWYIHKPCRWDQSDWNWLHFINLESKSSLHIYVFNGYCWLWANNLILVMFVAFAVFSTNLASPQRVS